MITLYASYNYPEFIKGILRDIRAFWALEELNLRYQVHWMDYAAREHAAGPNRAINPFGRVPSLENGALRIFESAAIVLYLYEHVGRAPQDAHARAELNQWCFAALNTVEPLVAENMRWTTYWKDRPGRDIRMKEVREQLAERLAGLESALAGKEWLTGSDLGPADILMVAVLNYGELTPGVFAPYPNIQSYIARAHARPAYRRALARQGARGA
ncbi:MAG TPA: glutathione S-transferase family protein [Rhizomicrobium sp.]|nr:glutathione S-transferase family protein [Rhizomicrobium sp.]